MALDLPTPGADLGTWGTKLNNALNGTGPGTLSATIATEVEASDYLPATYAALASGTLSGSWAFLGDSITYGSNATVAGGYAGMVTHLSGQKIRLTNRAATQGYRSDQVLPYVDSLVAPSGAKTCFILVGTNDAGQNVTRAVFAANITQIVTELREHGIAPVLSTVPPRADKRALVGEYNAWLRGYAAANAIPVVPTHAALVDSATGGMLAAYDSGDGIHPNLAGHLAIAQAIIDAVGALVPPTSGVPLATDNGDTTNRFANGLFLTDANADGIGDSWGNTGTATPTYSLVADAARWKGNAQKLVIATSAYRRIEQTVSTGFAPGDTLAWGCVYAIENVTGAIAGLKFDRVDTGGAGATTSFLSAINQNINRGVFWQRFVVPADTTAIKLRFVADATGGTADFLFAQATLLNLTTLGLV